MKRLSQMECIALAALIELTDAEKACNALGTLLGCDLTPLQADIEERGITDVLADQRQQYRCGECGSLKVQLTDWVDANTGFPTCGEEPVEDYYYCNDCSVHVTLAPYAKGQPAAKD
jgi:hypothetical protein